MPLAKRNTNVPAIPPVFAEPNALASSCDRMREGIESLAGHRGSPVDRAVTFADLIQLKLITPDQAPAAQATPVTRR